MKRVYAATASTDDMLNAFEAKLSMMKPTSVESSEKIEGSWYDDEDEDTEGWVKVERKQVQDFDGFYTDYTLWYNEITDEWCTVFGDNDIYHPWDSTHDMDFENNESEARDWFYDYNTEDLP